MRPDNARLSYLEYADKPLLLLVDDDPLIVDSLSLVLQDYYHIITAESRNQARKLLQNLSEQPSLALVDLGLPPKVHSPEEGFSLIQELLSFNQKIKTLVLSGQSDHKNIQHALTLGAVDFIPKPCDIDLLLSRLQHQDMMLLAETTADKDNSHHDLLGQSQAIESLRSMIQQFANTPFAVMVNGESGTGKELVAQELHVQSERSSEPFLVINCAAFSGDLLEAQLFGHSKGAFTGASEEKAGFFEEAGKGSLFLDEIGELPLDLQSKLLRVLENGEYYRVGETQPRRSAARIIAATNRDLVHEVQQGQFRQDLYHRLTVLNIYVPPLRERADDIELLMEFFQKMFSTQGLFQLDTQAHEFFLAYEFPGNVRELKNIVIRLGAKYPSQTVSLKQLKQELETDFYPQQTSENGASENLQAQLQAGNFILDDVLSDWEARYISTALSLCDGNLSQAARMLGVNRTTLHSRIQKMENHTDQDS